MKEYVIHYIGYEDGEISEMVGSGHGENGQEAVRNFLQWHSECLEIRSVRLFREYRTA